MPVLVLAAGASAPLSLGLRVFRVALTESPTFDLAADPKLPLALHDRSGPRRLTGGTGLE